jgi:serine/threonine-protein kinase
MARQCSQCGRIFADSQAFCTDDGSALPEPNPALGQTGIAARVPTAEGGPGTAPHARGTFGPATAPAAMPDFGLPQLDPLQPGATVGEYVVEEQIGEGGMGVIFAAKHPIIGKRVAIKVLNPDMAANAAIVQRFIQEARAVNQIGHRNIVDIFSFGRLADGRHYFVMEYLGGQPFSRRIGEPMTWQDAINIWLQMSSAIEAAHSHGIIHRDLKPDNIFIVPGPDGPFVKVLDFGIAKLLGEGQSVQKTGTGVPMGTPLYMSPEQTKGESVDHRTDLYAVGCIFYETIVGLTPFHAPSYFEVMSKQLTEPPPPFGSRARVNPALEALVFALLAKDPAGRPQNMGQVRTELVRLRDLAIQHSQPLFERTGAPGTPAEAAPAPQNPQPATVPWQPAQDAGFTVPEPRDSTEMRAIEAVRAQAAPKGRSTMVLIVVGLVALTLGGAYVASKKEQPRVVVAPAPVVPAPAAPLEGRVKILSTESGVTFTLDGKPAGEGGPVLVVAATPGRHEVKVTRPGFLPYSNQVMVAAGETTDEVVKLQPVPIEALPAATHTPSKDHKPATKPAAPAHAPTGPRDKDSTIDPFGR